MSIRVVIADDEPAIRHVVTTKLRNAGFEVQAAEDGEEALDICLGDPPDLLITDYQMPFLSGLELCQALREHDQTKNTPALMLTARGFDIEISEMVQAGIASVLAKPFSPRELLDKVRELLGSRVESVEA